MKRIHAFEFEDFGWFPTVLRNYMTDYLQFVSNSLDIYKPVIYLLEKGLGSAGNSTIVDIASGGGGGLIGIARHLMPNRPGLKIILTAIIPMRTLSAIPNRSFRKL
jgi:hypothetical protein